MARRIVTARDQVEMLSPWHGTASRRFIGGDVYRGIKGLPADLREMLEKDPSSASQAVLDHVRGGGGDETTGGLGRHWSEDEGVAQGFARSGFEPGLVVRARHPGVTDPGLTNSGHEHTPIPGERLVSIPPGTDMEVSGMSAWLPSLEDRDAGWDGTERGDWVNVPLPPGHRMHASLLTAMDWYSHGLEQRRLQLKDKIPADPSWLEPTAEDWVGPVDENGESYEDEGDFQRALRSPGYDPSPTFDQNYSEYRPKTVNQQKWYHVSPHEMSPGDRLAPLKNESYDQRRDFYSPPGGGDFVDDELENPLRFPSYDNHTRRNYVWMSPKLRPGADETGPNRNYDSRFQYAQWWADRLRMPYVNGGSMNVYEVRPSHQPKPWNLNDESGWAAPGARVVRKVPEDEWRDRTASRRTAMPSWYHVSPHELPEGMMLVPQGGKSPHQEIYDNSYFSGAKDHVWVDKLQHAPGWPGSHVYQVEPTDTPKLWDEKNPSMGWVTPSAKIVRKYPESILQDVAKATEDTEDEEGNPHFDEDGFMRDWQSRHASRRFTADSYMPGHRICPGVYEYDTPEGKFGVKRLKSADGSKWYVYPPHPSGNPDPRPARVCDTLSEARQTVRGMVNRTANNSKWFY